MYERAEFERELKKCNDWLKAKEAGLKPIEHLPIDAQGMDKELEELHETKDEIDNKVIFKFEFSCYVLTI